MSTRVHAPVNKDPTRRKKKKKPDWDATVSDLTIHKLSKEELENRKQKAKSKNAEAAKHELYEKAKASVTRDRSGDFGTSPRGGLEHLVPGTELHQVLAQSDKALAVVKDLFGDDPVRYTVHPTVTLAPHVTSSKKKLERTVQESMAGGPRPTVEGSPGGIRDESVLDLVPRQKAINDPESSSESSSEEDDPVIPESRGYTPSIDLGRFHKFVHEVERKSRNSSDRTALGHAQLQSQALPAFNNSVGQLSDLSVIPPPLSVDQDGHSLESCLSPVSSMEETQQASAMPVHGHRSTAPQHPLHTSRKASDKTGPVQVDPKAQCIQSESSIASTRTLGGRGGSKRKQGSQLEVLGEMVGKLELELEDYEDISGKHFSVEKPTTFQAGTLSGLTASLLTSITKLAHYLKESEVQLKGEVALRDQLLNTMNDQQNLMEALTTDLVKFQEQNCSLEKELNDLRENTQQQIRKLQEDVVDLQNKITVPSQSEAFCYKQHTHSPEANLNRTSVSPGAMRNAKSDVGTPVASEHFRVVEEASGGTPADQGTSSGHPGVSVVVGVGDGGQKGRMKTSCGGQCSDTRSAVANVDAELCSYPLPPADAHSAKAAKNTNTGPSSVTGAVSNKDSSVPSLTGDPAMPPTCHSRTFGVERKVNFSVQPNRRERVSAWQLTDSTSRITVDPNIPQPSGSVSQSVYLSRTEIPIGFPTFSIPTSSNTQTVPLSSTQGKHFLGIPPCVTSSSGHPVCTPSPHPTDCAPHSLHLGPPFQLPSSQSSTVHVSGTPVLGALLPQFEEDNPAVNESFNTNAPLHPNTFSNQIESTAFSVESEKGALDFAREPLWSPKGSALPVCTSSSSKTAYLLTPPDLSMSFSSVGPEKQGTTSSQTLPTLEDLQASMERMSLMAKTVLQDIQREKESLSKHQLKGASETVAYEKALLSQPDARDNLVPITAAIKSSHPGVPNVTSVTQNAFSTDKVSNISTKSGWFALSSHLAQTQ